MSRQEIDEEAQEIRKLSGFGSVPLPTTEGIQCRRCRRYECRESRPEGIADLICAMLGRYPYRCYSCAFRFRSAKPADPDDDPGPGQEQP